MKPKEYVRHLPCSVCGKLIKHIALNPNENSPRVTHGACAYAAMKNVRDQMKK